MAKHYTPRGKALHWLSTHRGITENPWGSNFDTRADGIRAAQRRCANGGTWLDRSPWCGEWQFSALKAAGVKGITSRIASVGLIEDDARAGRNGFRGWTTDYRRAQRGDLAVMFGRGVHVEGVRRILPKAGVVITDGGNTSSGNAGSQSNGGGSYRRVRKLSDVHGYALVRYPGALGISERSEPVGDALRDYALVAKYLVSPRPTYMPDQLEPSDDGLSTVAKAKLGL